MGRERKKIQIELDKAKVGEYSVPHPLTEGAPNDRVRERGEPHGERRGEARGRPGEKAKKRRLLRGSERVERREISERGLKLRSERRQKPYRRGKIRRAGG